MITQQNKICTRVCYDMIWFGFHYCIVIGHTVIILWGRDIDTDIFWGDTFKIPQKVELGLPIQMIRANYLACTCSILVDRHWCELYFVSAGVLSNHSKWF